MDQVSLRSYCEEARSLIQSGELEKAIHITRHILRQYPRHLDSYRLLGEALLEAGNDQEAAKQFRRVLSAAPEDVTSRVGLARIDEASGNLDKAIWQIQCAIELSPSDSDLRAQLDRLASIRQGGDASGKFDTTRVALGSIYARRGLHAKAVQEFKAALTQNPARLDVQAALAETLWRADDHLEAAEVSQRILEDLPNALKANLFIGVLWLENSRPHEAEPYLSVAQELDPENLVAQSLFVPKSLLSPIKVMIDRLGEDDIDHIQIRPSPSPPAENVSPLERPEPATDWTSELQEEESTPMSDEERSDEELEPLPDWLQGVGDDISGGTDDQPAASEPSEQDPVEGDETPEWLQKLVARTEEEPVASDESLSEEPEAVPDWLQELSPEPPEEAPTDSDAPDWLASITAGHSPDDLEPTPDTPAPAAEEALIEEPETPAVPVTETEIGEVGLPPELAVEGLPIEEPEAPVVPGAETELGEDAPPDWLAELQEPETPLDADIEEAVIPVSLDEAEPSYLEPVGEVVDELDVPDWLREIAAGEPVPSDEVEPVTTPTESVPEVEVEIDEAGLPDWLQDYEEPVAEEELEAEPVAPEVLDEPTASAEDGRALWEQILAEEGVDLETAEEAPPPEAAGMTAEEWLRSTADLEGTPSSAETPEPAAEVPEAPPMPEAEAEISEVGLPPEPAAEEPLIETVMPVMPVAETEMEEDAPPDWLAELQEPDTPLDADVEEAVTPTPIEEMEPAILEPVSDIVPEADIPDWLQEAEEPELADADLGAPDTPEWLKDLQEPEPVVEVEPSAEALPELTTEIEEEIEIEVEVDEAGLPDWLREPTTEAAGTAEPEPAAEPSAEMPEWLSELETEEMPLVDSEIDEPVELETGEMPEWLGEIMAGEPPLSEEWAAEPEVDVPAEAEIGEEPVPDWLRDYREREWEDAPEPTAEATEPEAPAEEPVIAAEETVQAELPDWLHRLREGVPEAELSEIAEEPVAEVEAEPVEMSVEAEAEPPVDIAAEPEILQVDEAGPEWLEDLVPAEEGLAELEEIEEEPAFPEAVAPPAIEYAEVEEEVEALPAEPELEPVEIPEPMPAPEVEPVATEAVAPPAIEYAEVEEEVEATLAEPIEPEIEPVVVPEPVLATELEPIGTRELEEIRVEDLPKDPAARLSMARAALNAGDWSEALTIYETLVNSSEMLDDVIDNLETGVLQHPDNAAGYQLLGDASMKDGRLQDALQAYRTALTKL